eukprot:SAG31_NODE_2648_length_5299_cov_7.289615_4_plen_73_part_00
MDGAEVNLEGIFYPWRVLNDKLSHNAPGRTSCSQRAKHNQTITCGYSRTSIQKERYGEASKRNMHPLSSRFL